NTADKVERCLCSIRTEVHINRDPQASSRDHYRVCDKAARAAEYIVNAQSARLRDENRAASKRPSVVRSFASCEACGDSRHAQQRH
ncbi:hypothetical protein T492DRAFT_953271, partial [Pavlovales sp. CCMP2436]